MLYGSKNYYSVIRFFITIYERIKLTKNAVGKKLRDDLDRLKIEKGIDISAYEENFDKIKEYRFKCIISTLFSIIKSQKDVSKYEDKLRQLLGMQAYVLFTFDKAVSNIMKPISTLKSDNFSNECWKLFKKYEDSPFQYKEEMYYNDFLRLLIPTSEPDLLVRIVYWPETGIINCHGFSFEPYTTDRNLTQILKNYKKDLCSKYEDVFEETGHDSLLEYKWNEHNSKNGSIKIPYDRVFLNRNVKRVKSAIKARKRENKASEKEQHAEELQVTNNLSNTICHKSLTMKFKQGSEDVVLRKRPKLNEIVEFKNDLIKAIRIREIFHKLKFE